MQQDPLSKKERKQQNKAEKAYRADGAQAQKNDRPAVNDATRVVKTRDTPKNVDTIPTSYGGPRGPGPVDIRTRAAAKKDPEGNMYALHSHQHVINQREHYDTGTKKAYPTLQEKAGKPKSGH